MDAFTKYAKLTGVPLKDTKIKFQKYVNNINITGNVAPFAGKNIKRGNIEIWNCNYAGYNAAKVPNADGSFDFGDQLVQNGFFGSMQIHDYAAKQTIFAFNNVNSVESDFGFGNNTQGKNKDWTFSKTGKSYKSIKIYTFLSNR